MKGGQKLHVQLEEICLLCVILLLVFLCPYSKVEESFNTQASHDILYFGLDLDFYDHLEFPGVVPRSFIGPLFLTSIVYPFHLGLSALNAPRLYSQLAIRIVLGTLNWAALIHFKRSAGKLFGRQLSITLSFMLLAQFHTLFYVSRTLPNSFAFGLVLVSISEWMNDNCCTSLFIMTFTTVVFRCDMMILLVPLGLSMLFTGLPFMTGLLTGISSVIVSLVFVDSFFWKKYYGENQLIWPEGMVLFFNSVENRSSEWGVSPFYWYFLSAIPKSILLPIIFLPFAFMKFPENLLRVDQIYIDWRVVVLSLPIFSFLLLYSLLPHKELRFILPVIPVLTMLCANGADKLMNISNRWIKKTATAMFYTSCAMSGLVVWLVFVPASMNNYYGGDALSALHQIYPHNESFWIHMDVSTCMNGVTRFVEEGRLFNWRYSKNETISDIEIQSTTHCDNNFCGYHGGYDILITSTPSAYETTFVVEKQVVGLDTSRLSASYALSNPFSVPTTTKLYIMKRKH